MPMYNWRDVSELAAEITYRSAHANCTRKANVKYMQRRGHVVKHKV